MKKLNNKGFAVASILYSIMVLFLILLLSILGILGSRKATLDRNKKEILGILNSEDSSADIIVRYGSISFKHRNITIVNRGNKDDIEFALMDGVVAVDADGNEINASNITYDLDLSSIENKSYKVTYTANSNGETVTGTRIVTFTGEDIKYDYDYTGDEKIFTVDYRGNYKLETWGASGGDADSYAGGKGGYSRDQISLLKNDVLHVVVGQVGESLTGGCSTNSYVAYNGGGRASCQSSLYYGSGGGGATHIAISPGLLSSLKTNESSILIVAGGGGGAASSSSSRNDVFGVGGAGGGNFGLLGTNESNKRTPGGGGTQDEPGATSLDGSKQPDLNSDFGQGCVALSTYDSYMLVSGGGGYYGGGCGTHSGAGGGSGHISSSNGTTLDGTKSIPNYNGNGNMIGNTGNGYAKISLLYYY